MGFWDDFKSLLGIDEPEKEAAPKKAPGPHAQFNHDVQNGNLSEQDISAYIKNNRQDPDIPTIMQKHETQEAGFADIATARSKAEVPIEVQTAMAAPLVKSYENALATHDTPENAVDTMKTSTDNQLDNGTINKAQHSAMIKALSGPPGDINEFKSRLMEANLYSLADVPNATPTQAPPANVSAATKIAVPATAQDNMLKSAVASYQTSLDKHPDDPGAAIDQMKIDLTENLAAKQVNQAQHDVIMEALDSSNGDVGAFEKSMKNSNILAMADTAQTAEIQKSNMAIINNETIMEQMKGTQLGAVLAVIMAFVNGGDMGDVMKALKEQEVLMEDTPEENSTNDHIADAMISTSDDSAPDAAETGGQTVATAPINYQQGINDTAFTVVADNSVNGAQPVVDFDNGSLTIAGASMSDRFNQDLANPDPAITNVIDAKIEPISDYEAPAANTTSEADLKLFGWAS